MQTHNHPASHLLYQPILYRRGHIYDVSAYTPSKM
jgi:hypothetical protein